VCKFTYSRYNFQRSFLLDFDCEVGPIAMLPEACMALDISNTEIMESSPVRGVEVPTRFAVLSCVGTGLATG